MKNITKTAVAAVAEQQLVETIILLRERERERERERGRARAGYFTLIVTII